MAGGISESERVIMGKLPFRLKMVLFYLLAFVLTGVFFLLQVGANIPGEYIQLPQFGPALAALAFLALERRRIGPFLRNGFRLRVDGQAGYMALSVLAPVVLMAALSLMTTRLWGVANRGDISPVLFVSTLIAAACEEIGWRGYMLKQLQSRLSPVPAALLLGVLWGFWHVPKIMLGAGIFAVWFVGLIGLSVALAIIFNRTGSSILTATLVHTAVNLAAGGLLPGAAADIRVTFLLSIGFVAWSSVLVWLEKRAKAGKRSADPAAG